MSHFERGRLEAALEDAGATVCAGGPSVEEPVDADEAVAASYDGTAKGRRSELRAFVDPATSLSLHLLTGSTGLSFQVRPAPARVFLLEQYVDLCGQDLKGRVAPVDVVVQLQL